MLDVHPRHNASPRIAFHDFGPVTDDFRAELLAGLSAPRKAIPCRFLYDARGSALFEAICEQPEYYPTRTEISILQAQAGTIAERVGPDAQLIELGSGASRKVRLLLDALPSPAAYVAVDISREALRDAAEAIAADYPGLAVHAVCADYDQAFDLPQTEANGRRVGFFPGSTIGNFEPEAARRFLAGWARRLGPGAAMIIGVDLKKDVAALDAAYDDQAGVTAEFSRNLLMRANRELGADFDLEGFAHWARYDAERGCVEIHLRSLRAQAATLSGRQFDFAEGELVHIEDSYKYEAAEFASLAKAAGFEAEAVWIDRKALFSVHYLTVGPSAPANDAV